jgi:hypothetical protein
MIDHFERQELKYFVPSHLMDTLRQRLLNHTIHDPYCEAYPDWRYPVRSLYFDTRRHLFYFEKIQGLKNRKKLRIRIYSNSEESNTAFLEIKRKRGKIIFKERALIPYNEISHTMNGSAIHLIHPDLSTQRNALHHYTYLMKRLNLVPTVVIVYEREAFQGIDDPTLRMTFDIDTRSHPSSELSGLTIHDDLLRINERCFILEVKFARTMPLWLRTILRDFHLRLQAISKYCEGLDIWQSSMQTSKVAP